MVGVGMQSRIAAVLGGDGQARMASALRCCEARFKYPRARQIVVAVIELLETARGHGVPPDALPLRWHADSAATTATGDEIRQRFAALFGNVSLVARLAFAAGMSVPGVRAILRSSGGRGLADFQTVVELLELLELNNVPRAAWPSRWRMLAKCAHKRPGFKSIAPSGRDMAQRLALVLGGRHPSASFARALSRTPNSFSRVWRGERDSRGRVAVVQPETLALIELLETLKAEGVPVERWPARWRKAIEAASRTARLCASDAAHQSALPG